MRCPVGDGAPGEVGDKEAGHNVDDDLHQQNGVVMFATEEHEARGEEGRVSRQPYPGGPDDPVLVGQPEDALGEPILGDIAIDQGIACDERKLKEEDQPQGQSGERHQQEEECGFADQAPERGACSGCRTEGPRGEYSKELSAISRRLSAKAARDGRVPYLRQWTMKIFVDPSGRGGSRVPTSRSNPEGRVRDWPPKGDAASELNLP